MKLFWAYLSKNWLHILDICDHVQFTHCTRDLLQHLKHSCITKVSLQRDLRSKVQHLQRGLRNLMMVCTRCVSLLFSFVILRSNSLLRKLMSCLGKFANSNIPNAGS